MQAYSRLLIYAVIPLCFLAASCATTTGPSVSSQEIRERSAELEAKAALFKQKQLERVRAIAERLIQFMPQEDQAKLNGLTYQVSDEDDLNASVTMNNKKLATSVVSQVVGLAAGTTVEGLTQGSGLGGVVSQGVSQGVSGSFSRDYEREADYFGCQYVYISGFDLIKGMGVWERFAVEASRALTVGL